MIAVARAGFAKTARAAAEKARIQTLPLEEATVANWHLIAELPDEALIVRLEPTRLIVEEAEIVVHEGDEPDVLGHLLDPDVLPRKHLTQVDLAALVTDPAAMGDRARPIVEAKAGRSPRFASYGWQANGLQRPVRQPGAGSEPGPDARSAGGR